MSMQHLDLHTIPLTGHHLIEASAGTGKTYTIASLYLRLLLEQGLSVKQILVVTFTNAATEELRDRIRKRIREALLVLKGETCKDPLLQQLLDGCEDSKATVQTLKDALTLLDEAAVYTIHGFCQRMLTENAFESGSLFDADFITDESDYLRAISEDFWRKQFYQFDQYDAQWLRSCWATPSALLSSVRRYLKRPELTIIPEVSQGQVDNYLQQRSALIEQVQQYWRVEGDDIRELLCNYDGFNGNKYRKATLEQALQAMDQFAIESPPQSLPHRMDMLSASKLATVMKKGFQPPQHVFFGLCDELSAAWQASDDTRRFSIIQQFVEYLHQELAERKANSNIISTDDLLIQLRAALNGAGSDRLADHIRSQYPVAMIDEFQDTDPVQYDIFHHIYQGDHDAALYMIGDPKQAIYSFRGADIFTYMQARHDTNNHYTLHTNWRSSTSLVNTINGLFMQSPSPFIYEDDIQYLPVEAAGKADEAPLFIEGESTAPLQVWSIHRTDENIAKRGPKEITKGWALNRLAQQSAEEIARLLNLALENKAKIGDEPLQAKDIAVLVRSHGEAFEVQQALRAYGIASAYISRDSVFDSPEARAVGRLLMAVLEPANERYLRAALCDSLIAQSANTLLQLLEDESAWENILEQFQNYHSQWRDHGFMTMFQSLLHQQQIPQRCLQQPQGERVLSNVLQLAELLQAASKQQHGMEGLCHWYFTQLEEPGDEDERQLRLESDEALVQIVTIHKSKGLEYGVVFLPFIYGSFPVKNNQPLLFHEPIKNSLMLDLGSDDFETHYDLSDKERLAEELRLLYVALTRAKYRCYLAWGQISGASSSALAYLLHGEQMASMSDDEIMASWQQLGGEINLVPLPDAHGQRHRGASHGEQNLTAKSFSSRINRSWQVSSFSALTSHRRGHANILLPDYDQQEITATPQKRQRDIFSFPRGANAGHMLHTLFENIDFTQPWGDEQRTLVNDQLLKYGFDVEWLPVLEHMISDVLNTELDNESGLTLSKISAKQKLVELEFYFPLATLNADKLNALLIEHGHDWLSEAGLGFIPHQGMMTGFVDLVFEYQGQYFIADYKSNHLGDSLDCYGDDQLQQAMIEHQYHLQYLIYTVALHRYLKHRLPGYDYNQHMGGAYYLFLRGMRPGQGDNSGVFFDKPSLSLIDGLDQLFSGGQG